MICKWMITLMFLGMIGANIEGNALEKTKETEIDSAVFAKVIENQLSAIRSGEINEAYTAYTSKEFRNITNLENFERFVKNFRAISNNKTVKIDHVSMLNNIATLQVTLTGQGNEDMGAEYDLIKEGDQWKILGIQMIRPADSIK